MLQVPVRAFQPGVTVRLVVFGCLWLAACGDSVEVTLLLSDLPPLTDIQPTAEGGVIVATSSREVPSGSIVLHDEQGRTSVLAEGEDPSSLAIAGELVVWAGRGQAVVRAIPLDGGQAYSLVSGNSVPSRSICSTGTQLVFSTAGSEFDWRLEVVDVASSAVRPLSVTGSRVVALQCEGDWIYWCEPDAGLIRRAPFAGGEAETLVMDHPGVNRLVVSSGEIVWSNDDEELGIYRAVIGSQTSARIASGILHSRAGLCFLSSSLSGKVFTRWCGDTSASASIAFPVGHRVIGRVRASAETIFLEARHNDGSLSDLYSVDISTLFGQEVP
jgi:hypothetical protein